MFDPTVFDNLKVVIEGHIYDLDLSEELLVVDRSDIVDLAKMSRRYSISYSFKGNKQTYVKLEIEMDHFQLSGELLKTRINPGCKIQISLNDSTENQEVDELLIRKLKRLWGNNHLIKILLTKEIPLKSRIYQYIVIFTPTYGEDDLDEILQIINNSVDLLKTLG